MNSIRLFFWFFFIGNIICAIVAVLHSSWLALFNGGSAAYMIWTYREWISEGMPEDDEEEDL